VERGQRVRRTPEAVRLARGALNAVLLATACGVAVLDPTYLGLGLAAGCLVLVALGSHFHGDFAFVAGGWLLYFPLAAVMAYALGPFWSYLAAGTYLAILTERLSFESQLSKAIGTAAGVDSEGERLADRLSVHHLRRLMSVAGVVAAIGFVSLAASVVLAAVDVLIVASLLIIIVVGIYAAAAGRTANRKR
jgi:hypothetical protein